MSKPQVILYTVKDSEHCRLAREWLKDHGVEFNEVDITTDEAASEKLAELTGQWSVPVIQAEEEGKPTKVIVGYEPSTMKEVLGLE